MKAKMKLQYRKKEHTKIVVKPCQDNSEDFAIFSTATSEMPLLDFKESKRGWSANCYIDGVKPIKLFFDRAEWHRVEDRD